MADGRKKLRVTIYHQPSPTATVRVIFQRRTKQKVIVLKNSGIHGALLQNSATTLGSQRACLHSSITSGFADVGKLKIFLSKKTS